MKIVSSAAPARDSVETILALQKELNRLKEEVSVLKAAKTSSAVAPSVPPVLTEPTKHSVAPRRTSDPLFSQLWEYVTHPK